MNTKVLMTISSIILGVFGLSLIFGAEEISNIIVASDNQVILLVFQILGATYFGFAMLNWMTKHNLIGGIYSKPLVIGNLVHFLVGSFALVKIVMHLENNIEIMWGLTIIYVGLTLCFGYVLMTDPNKVKKS